MLAARVMLLDFLARGKGLVIASEELLGVMILAMNLLVLTPPVVRGDSARIKVVMNILMQQVVAQL